MTNGGWRERSQLRALYQRPSRIQYCRSEFACRSELRPRRRQTSHPFARLCIRRGGKIQIAPIDSKIIAILLRHGLLLASATHRAHPVRQMEPRPRNRLI